MTLKYSETFFSAQGEGQYVGIPSLWMRFFLCNLQCNGFGQKDPTDPGTYDLPYEKIDITNIESVFDLPVFDKGCDSSYTWSKKYRHLITDKTVTEAVDELTALLPHGKFMHPVTGQESHMVFTGGEPMLKNTQPGMMQVIDEFKRRNNQPMNVTVETNGTRPITDEFAEWIQREYTNWVGREWYWSLSPKLWATAGEKHKKAIQPEVVGRYAEVSPHGQLKYVVNGTDESWREVEENTKLFREAGCNYPVWIMGVGGTFEGLVQTEASIADEAIRRGYYYTSRVHVHIYGNAIGK
ncbi:MAG: 7-carboxy-7-deazaguanine synthase QueE [Candidatus Thorarchaeota archaeon]